MNDRNLALEVVRITEAAALASARLMGRGDRKLADHVAVEAMRRAFDTIDIRGTVVIGEGERDEAPMLYIGEKVGAGWLDNDADSPRVDIAVDPLEGTNLCATGAPDAISVIAIADDGQFLNAPDTYMQKIAVGPACRGQIDLRESPTWNLRRIAAAKGKQIEEVTAVILDRDRHSELIAEVRAAGARIRLIGDGDVSGAVMTANNESGIDVLFGTGGAPEGVIAAAALRCLGGELQGRLKFRSDDERARAVRMGVKAEDHIYTTEELAQGHVMFAATGVTQGYLLDGVTFTGGGATTQSIVMRSKSGTVRRIHATHRFDTKPAYFAAGGQS
ncbi:MAG: class II fructose-bisphosphatase [Kofleriaceae bacterium]|jgi:fructose-1,6-bisphosphatase II|nr:class II fructose-bisphosphatase [Kofleriaceae bacterium]MBP9167131.1 class II fructose-bisphosphatase [Kofleriaceae bacterium]MBP9860958.1 class II fructose-bisphosphatase [Kofleriaceae bacterium]